MIEFGDLYKMSAENEFWRQNKAARAALARENGVPIAMYRKMFSQARGHLETHRGGLRT